MAKKTASRKPASLKKSGPNQSPAKAKGAAATKASAAKTSPVSKAKPAGKAPPSAKLSAKAAPKSAPASSKGRATSGSPAKAKANKAVEWSYLRANCKTCEKAETWLGKAGIAIGPRVDARKQTINAAEGLKLAKSVNEVRVAKGAKVTTLSMKKGAPSDAELGSLIIGPTGNLRAPTLRQGKTLVVGFNDQLYSEFFAS